MADQTAKPLFTVSDGYELHALFLALMEAKFHPEPRSPELQGSPFMARMCERAAEAVTEWMASKGWQDQGERLRSTYLSEPDDVTLTAVRKRLGECKKWTTWSDDERVLYVRLLLSPYSPGEGVVRQLVAERTG
jgi:hypothetical protein